MSQHEPNDTAGRPRKYGDRNAVKCQLVLSAANHEWLTTLSKQTGKYRSELANNAIDEWTTASMTFK